MRKLVLPVAVTCLGAAVGYLVSVGPIATPPGKPSPPPASPVEALASARPTLLLQSAFVRLPLAPLPGLRDALGRAVAGGGTIFLLVEDMTTPAKKGVVCEVFLVRRGEKVSPDGYVGPITFFGRKPGAVVSDGFDVSAKVRDLAAANRGSLPELDVYVSVAFAGEKQSDLKVPVRDITLSVLHQENP